MRLRITLLIGLVCICMFNLRALDIIMDAVSSFAGMVLRLCAPRTRYSLVGRTVRHRAVPCRLLRGGVHHRMVSGVTTVRAPSYVGLLVGVCYGFLLLRYHGVVIRVAFHHPRPQLL